MCILKIYEEKFGKCVNCKQIITAFLWCRNCISKIFQQNFVKWTSGNDDIDKLIQNTQLSAENHLQVLEWIPYDKFSVIEYVAEGGFGKVYRANWKDGYILSWDTCKQQFRRHLGVHVALKILNKSKNITFKFISEITSNLKIHEDDGIMQHVIKCHGVTQDPITKDYIIVMNYGSMSLQNCLNREKYKFCNEHEHDKHALMNVWKKKLEILHGISRGLERIHAKNLVHRDLHIGNIINFRGHFCITDLGLCKPANFYELESMEDVKYGVLSYMAPELLRGQDYTKASDIYSFGIIMYVVISGLLPYYNFAHDEFLALNICEGLRPEFNTNIKVPQLIMHLIKRCLDANPLNRPNANELPPIFNKWYSNIYPRRKKNYDKMELIEQIKEFNNNISASTNNSPLASKMHSETIYISKPYNFKNLPEPKNSDDYYKSYENISSKKYSVYFLKPDDNDHEDCAIRD
ncbi:hypothetical protein RclHR1_01490019 [Rhizophagus clarus]|nr:hypothetical protein RclHR1_01490019 [Rhizophagus clarus]